MRVFYPVWRFFLCALAIWPVPHQLAVHFYQMNTRAGLSGREMPEGEESCALETLAMADHDAF
jgi:hypothetical protein